MKYLLATLILTAQEVVTMNALLFETKQGHYIPWIIHTIFCLTTALGIWIGYYIGVWAKRKYTKGKLVAFANKCAERFHAYAGKRGRKVALFVLGNVGFPHVNGFLAAWLDVPFKEAFPYLFAANIFFYVIDWLFISGVSAVAPSPLFGLGIVVGGTLLFLLFSKYRR